MKLDRILNISKISFSVQERGFGLGRCIPPKARTGTKSAPVRMASLTKPLRRLSTRRRECGCASNDSRAPPTTIVMPLPIPSPFEPPRDKRFSQDSRDTEASPIDRAYSRYKLQCSESAFLSRVALSGLKICLTRREYCFVPQICS